MLNSQGRQGQVQTTSIAKAGVIYFVMQFPLTQ